MTEKRHQGKKGSNNESNCNKNICQLEVASYLGVAKNVRYLHYREDLIKALRTAYIVRSRRSELKGDTVSQVCKSIAQRGTADYYTIHVHGHVLLAGCIGQIIIDTAPRKSDRRKVLAIYGVYRKRS